MVGNKIIFVVSNCNWEVISHFHFCPIIFFVLKITLFCWTVKVSKKLSLSTSMFSFLFLSCRASFHLIHLKAKRLLTISKEKRENSLLIRNKVYEEPQRLDKSSFFVSKLNLKRHLSQQIFNTQGTTSLKGNQFVVVSKNL
jgi:hypothetical protein